MFNHRLILADGTPAEPPVFVSSVPDWHVGDLVMARPDFRTASCGLTSTGKGSRCRPLNLPHATGSRWF
jgi:hypothetical protein